MALRNAERPNSNSGTRFAIVIPFIVLPPWVLLFAFAVMGIPINWSSFVCGALGWLAALALRRPLAMLLAARKVNTRSIKFVVLCSSGPFEEGVRLCTLFVTGRSMAAAVAIGCGWAEAEALLTAAVTAVTLASIRKSPNKAEEIGPVQKTQAKPAAGWAVLERSSSSLTHVGFTLLAAAIPVVVFVTAVLHSLINIAAVSLITRSILWTQLLIFVFSIALFSAGLLLALRIG